MFQQPPKEGEPLFISTEVMFYDQLKRAADAHMRAEAEVSKVASTLSRLLDIDGKPIQQDKDRVIAQLNEILHRWLQEPTHLETWAELEGSVSAASFIVAYLFMMEYGRPLLQLFPEFANKLTFIPMLTLAELVDPKQPTLLEAFELALPVSVTHRGSNIKVLGPEGEKAKRTRLMGVLSFTLEFMRNKGAVTIANDTATLTDNGLKLLHHLQAMDLWIAAKYEAAKRLQIKELKAAEGGI